MKYLPLLLANLKRKKIRTGLTIGSFVVALFLFGLLAAIRAGFNQGIDVAGADRLIVIGRTVAHPAPAPPLPRAHPPPPGREGRGALDLVRRDLPGPQELLPAVRDRARAVAADVPRVRDRPDGQWKDFLADRQGVVVGAQARPALRLEDRRPHPAQGPRLHRRRRAGTSTSARSTRGTQAPGRRGAVLAPAQVLLREGARVLAGHRRLVHRAGRGPGRGPARGQGDRRRSSRTPPRRRAPRRSPPSPPRS